MTLKPQVKMNLQPISLQKRRTPRRAVFCMFLNAAQYGAGIPRRAFFCMFLKAAQYSAWCSMS